MEEYIKILESECHYLEELGYLRENNHFIRFNQALKNLIKGYKELEEIAQTQQAEIEKKDKIIDLMAKELVKAHKWFYSEFDNYTKEDFIKYFEYLEEFQAIVKKAKELGLED